jgi:molybdate transport system substrate-binding protein
MMSMPAVLAVSLVACAPSGEAGRSAPRDRPLLVSAAVSLSGVLETLVATYERDTGTRVELNLAGSSTLAAQIIAGAPVDLFISADEFQMERVAEEGLLRNDTRVALLSNQLVIVVPVVPADTAVTMTSVATLLEPKFARIAIGNPDGVPVGVYARAYLESVGLWDPIRHRVVPTRNTRAALATVESGTVDAGIVYRTDARSSSGVTVVFEVPVAEAPVIVYPAALTTHAANPEAAEHLLAYLQGQDARPAFERAGFIVPEIPR